MSEAIGAPTARYRWLRGEAAPARAASKKASDGCSSPIILILRSGEDRSEHQLGDRKERKGGCDAEDREEADPALAVLERDLERDRKDEECRERDRRDLHDGPPMLIGDGTKASTSVNSAVAIIEMRIE